MKHKKTFLVLLIIGFIVGISSVFALSICIYNNSSYVVSPSTNNSFNAKAQYSYAYFLPSNVHPVIGNSVDTKFIVSSSTLSPVSTRNAQKVYKLYSNGTYNLKIKIGKANPGTWSIRAKAEGENASNLGWSGGIKYYTSQS